MHFSCFFLAACARTLQPRGLYPSRPCGSLSHETAAAGSPPAARRHGLPGAALSLYAFVLWAECFAGDAPHERHPPFVYRQPSGTPESSFQAGQHDPFRIRPSRPHRPRSLSRHRQRHAGRAAGPARP
ncbi:hypothetical protein DVU_2734 [Nitratidesulfovibrio vulgaris str. Hildenborough]|uniref:Uncharacterized protein n=1 Tax=Nitratidesulfovibrio vulgaris (strain ATCC 29579 / DSM 644 / CCUG 34227 / NCIMB 8303 / VKM B-1760 / Hildenborough) TaxID=882 RepID=Q727X0_NITV2|nr:hypothetical protein DVU_2734 [Nitratidesulfovibrio vulgaris str. Hildenborough]